MLISLNVKDSSPLKKISFSYLHVVPNLYDFVSGVQFFGENHRFKHAAVFFTLEWLECNHTVLDSIRLGFPWPRSLKILEDKRQEKIIVNAATCDDSLPKCV